ncbi:transcriptional regulator [Sulfolobus sp. A20]|uniref:helix-turn-helix domain-containing protein n=1 Tax=Sulfolobaceae TaxID=118883 RepID=UPI000845CA01|nr:MULTISPECIES: helix-turn-helix domain-containing protein [unclassified Sulfolobus]TRM74365.1 helix-turn-helix domain-containing protein [Sulfolobus sp. E5]TRM78174.1 helix-turn-helix domain-containing protein [Sulfolobus sp. A20-N-F8]TRM79377.1 helix-turn-helix domain-containing protein [Sulfolobus sp. B5]TRM84137.1 helix-turn-helix domain-containing protein [Sulfolobus sp. A20-N-F6]TRM88837.1 helix-turn-helix domain-containing protein [Sulfolobus sp. C3]TRM98466.1 helix-turn-helix domain-
MNTKIIDEILDTLELKKYSYTLIKYPEHSRKSVDLIINSREPAIVKFSANEKVSKDEIADLKKLAVSSNKASLIITNEEQDDIVSIKADNVFAISPEGLMRVLNGEKIFLYRTRGGIFIKIRHDVLKTRREMIGYSIGDLAKLLGVSRKAIYDYERGDSDVSLEIAERLIDLFGDEIIGDIIRDSVKVKRDLEEEDEVSDTSVENFKVKLIHILKEEGLKVLSLKLTAVDLIVKPSGDKNEKYMIVIEGKDYAKSLKKFNEAKKIASYTNSELLVVSRSSRVMRECESLGYKTYEENSIHSLIDEIKGDSGGKS